MGHRYESYGGTDSIQNGRTGGVGGGNYQRQLENGFESGLEDGYNSAVSITSKIKDRKCYYNDSSHQATAPIISIA